MIQKFAKVLGGGNCQSLNLDLNINVTLIPQQNWKEWGTEQVCVNDREGGVRKFQNS